MDIRWPKGPPPVKSPPSVPPGGPAQASNLTPAAPPRALQRLIEPRPNEVIRRAERSGRSGPTYITDEQEEERDADRDPSPAPPGAPWRQRRCGRHDQTAVGIPTGPDRDTELERAVRRRRNPDDVDAPSSSSGQRKGQGKSRSWQSETWTDDEWWAWNHRDTWARHEWEPARRGRGRGWRS